MSLASLTSTNILTLQRPTKSQDASGGVVNSWSNIYTSVACTLQPVSAQERYAFAQRNIFLTHRIYATWDLAPERQDRFYEPSTGKYFIVVGHYNMGGRSRAYMTEVKEQTQ